MKLKVMKMPFFGLCLMTSLTLVSCFKGQVNPPPVSSPLAGKVLATHCLDCHRDYQSFKDSDFISKGLVVPGAPESSFLFASLKGSKSGAEETMPPQGSLTADDLRDLKRWIGEMKVPEVSKQTVTQLVPSDPLSEEELFQRCYGHWTRRQLQGDEALLKDVRDGRKSGVEACQELLSKLEMDSQGIVASEQGREILRTFQTFHRSWFSELNLYNTDEQWGNFEIYDPGMVAAYFTYGLLDSRFDVSSVLKGTDSFELVRNETRPRKYFIFPYQETSMAPLLLGDFKFGSGEEIKEDTYPKWNIGPIATGEIIGVRKTPKGRDRLPAMVDTRKGQKAYHGQRVYKLDQDIRESRGGGILGNPIFLLLNMKMEIGKASDGGKRIPRKWAATVYKDLLCRDLPVVPLPKAKKFLHPKSTLSFRKKNSCVQCHMSMDGLAGVIRNLEINYSVDSGLGQYIQTSHSRGRQASLPQKGKLLGDGSDAYADEPPYGLFAFQSTSGLYYEREIKNLDELGALIVKTPDFYQCLSKRYIFFMTGIDVDIEKTSELNSFENYVYSLNKKLATRLQDHRSLKKLIMDIVSTPLYRDRYFLKTLERKPASYVPDSH